jgi:dTDP-4-dehydrorhamnose reductase
MVVLVAGADSQIGGALVARFQSLGREVTGTSRRPGETDGWLGLDLADDATRWCLPEKVSVAFLCAAVTGLQACELDPSRTRRINVDGTLALAERLLERGAFVIFLSTNLVFDGSLPHRPAADAVSPQTEYGRQKAAAERGLHALGGDRAAVVRLTKVLTHRDPLLGDWVSRLRRGEPIHPFRQKVMAPVGLDHAVSVLEGVADRRLGGISQVSARRDLSYAEAAEFLCRSVGANPALVQPGEPASADLTLAAAPRHTTLCTRRIAKELGIEPPDPFEAIEKVIER